MIISGIFNSVKDIIFPVLCSSCRFHEPHLDKPLCLPCINNLSWIASDLDARAALIGKDFFPKDIKYFNSLVYYTKSSHVQSILKAIKYGGDQNLAVYLGHQLGDNIEDHHQHSSSILIPVPLHPKRMKERGFNQAEAFAKGLVASIPNWEIENDVLLRSVYEASQTKKGRKERSIILENSFAAGTKELPLDTSLILVDDVITTGSTVAACISVLRKLGYHDLSVLSLAVSI